MYNPDPSTHPFVTSPAHGNDDGFEDSQDLWSMHPLHHSDVDHLQHITSISSPPRLWDDDNETPSTDSSSSSSTHKRQSALAEAAEHMKSAHRKMDADRRQREAAIVRRLEDLTNEVDTSERRRGRKAKRLRKRKKVEVLQSCVEKLERLQELLKKLTEAPNKKDDQLRSLAEHLDQSRVLSSSSGLSPLPPSTSDSLRLLDANHSLYSSLFIHGHLSMALIDLASGELRDANSSAAANIAQSRWSTLAVVACLTPCGLFSVLVLSASFLR
jgi:hypothetical protein